MPFSIVVGYSGQEKSLYALAARSNQGSNSRISSIHQEDSPARNPSGLGNRQISPEYPSAHACSGRAMERHKGDAKVRSHDARRSLQYRQLPANDSRDAHVLTIRRNFRPMMKTTKKKHLTHRTHHQPPSSTAQRPSQRRIHSRTKLTQLQQQHTLPAHDNQQVSNSTDLTC